MPFYEESTYWNPSWTTAGGAIETTTIADMASSWEQVGLGTLLSATAHRAQIALALFGFGHADAKCPACRKLTASLNYGLGVVNIGPWITQTKNFYGAGATVGYLSAKHLTIAIATTLDPEAFDDKGNYPTPSNDIFSLLAKTLAPGSLPTRSQK